MTDKRLENIEFKINLILQKLENIDSKITLPPIIPESERPNNVIIGGYKFGRI